MIGYDNIEIEKCDQDRIDSLYFSEISRRVRHVFAELDVQFRRNSNLLRFVLQLCLPSIRPIALLSRL